jgi:hypothetical protein
MIPTRYPGRRWLSVVFKGIEKKGKGLEKKIEQ